MKRLKNIEINQKINNNDSDRNNLSSARSELSTKSLTSDDETQTSFEYLKDNTEEFFGGYPNIFDLDLKKFFNHIVSKEEKYINYSLLSEEILTSSGKAFSFLKKYGYLHNFWYNALLDHTISNDIISQQINFSRDLMNGFDVYENIMKPKNKSDHEAKYLYLKLLGNPHKNADDILFNKSRDKHIKEIYLQAKNLFTLREQIFKKLVDKGIMKKVFQREQN